MKKILLLAAIALLATTAGAQMKSKTECIATGDYGTVMSRPVTTTGQATSRRHLGPVGHRREMTPVKFSELTIAREMKMRDPSSLISSPSKGSVRADASKPFYRRPAGMYCAPCFLEGETCTFFAGVSYMMAKPYADYTWEVYPPAAVGSSINYAWDFWFGGELHSLDYQSKINFTTPILDTDLDTVPRLLAVNGRWDDATAQRGDYQIYGESIGLSQTDTLPHPALILSEYGRSKTRELCESDNAFPMYSSKTMVCGGRYHEGEDFYLWAYYVGAHPYGDNELGYWFGKNSGTSYNMYNIPINGIAQAFEKPQHPYLLENVYLAGSEWIVNRDVKMSCKVYRLDQIPGYQENEIATLPEVPGELVAVGEATVKPNIAQDEACVTFTLYDEEYGMTHEVHPVIDYPILVCIDGYNDAGMEDLVSFTAMMSIDDQVDEGYGELAYLKIGLTDEDDNFTGEYVWAGLNHFFSSGTMMTGFTIFIGTENPYLTFKHENEDGEYYFSQAGGTLTRTAVDGTTVGGIDFLTSNQSDSWTITCNGSETLPDWLDIELNDLYDGNEFSGVRAVVTAQPIPGRNDYREAVVKFEIAGDSREYRFMQGIQPTTYRGDVNNDGNVNISDVTQLISLLLTNATTFGAGADVNADGRLNISDVTFLISMLLSSDDLTPVMTGNRFFTVNGVTFKMIAVEGGTFAMGATRDQGSNANSVERPVHKVTLSDYYIGQTEVTQALWQAVMGTNPSNYTGDLNRPVEMVSWTQCQEFITRLNQLTGMEFRMLTEAEWEFAARGGNKMRGNMYSGSNDLGKVAWFKGNAGGTTHPVATKVPNELGIFDMSGNVYEWCQDIYDGGAYPSTDDQINPTGLESGDQHVIRGGSIDYDTDYCRNARRWSDLINAKWKDQGLRLAM